MAEKAPAEVSSADRSNDSNHSRTSRQTGSKPTAQVNIPLELVERISSRLPQSDFKTVDEYVSYVLGQVLAILGPSSRQEKSEPALSKEDQENVEQRLKDLGYM